MHPAGTGMAYTVSMSADDARSKLASGGTFLLLGAPDGLVFGIDQTVRCRAEKCFTRMAEAAERQCQCIP